MTDQHYRDAADLVRRLSDEGWSTSDIASVFCIGTGLIAGHCGQTEDNVLAAVTVIESVAGIKSNASLATCMPCPDCWRKTLDGLAERGITGSATYHCGHRNLVFTVHASAGEATAWKIHPMSADELDRATTREHFRRGGLKPVH